MSTCAPGCTHESHALTDKQFKKQARLAAKEGRKANRGTNPQPQQALSRRTRRFLARKAAKATQGVPQAEIQAQDTAEKRLSVVPDIPPVFHPPVADMTLGDIRRLAQFNNVRVDGKRPSLCNKTDLVEALDIMQKNGTLRHP